jgi:hypothetical protein
LLFIVTNTGTDAFDPLTVEDDAMDVEGEPVGICGDDPGDDPDYSPEDDDDYNDGEDFEDEEVTENNYNTDENVPLHREKKFIVFYSSLKEVFSWIRYDCYTTTI